MFICIVNLEIFFPYACCNTKGYANLCTATNLCILYGNNLINHTLITYILRLYQKEIVLKNVYLLSPNFL